MAGARFDPSVPDGPPNGTMRMWANAAQAVAQVSGLAETVASVLHARALRSFAEGIRQYLAVRLASVDDADAQLVRLRERAAEWPADELVAPPGARARLYREARRLADEVRVARSLSAEARAALPWRMQQRGVPLVYAEALRRLRDALDDDEADTLELRHARELAVDEVAFVRGEDEAVVVERLAQAEARASEIVGPSPKSRIPGLHGALIDAFELAPPSAPAKAKPDEAGFEAGTMIGGRYQLEKRVGAGAFGDVYRAIDTEVAGPRACEGDVVESRDEEAQTMTVQAALQWAVAALQAGQQAPRLTAELLLAHVLGWERSRLLGHGDDPVKTAARVRFQALVRRGASGEPLHYLIGEKEFYGIPFRVTPEVLIPRPETEILVEKALALAGSRKNATYVDVGTGSGCIAVAVAHGLPNARGWATDISPRALALAHENAGRAGVGPQIEFVRCDLLDGFAARPLFDFVLSNPPYVARSDMDALPLTVREFEPREALDGGASGLEVYRRLIPQASARLGAQGYLLLEVGAGQAPEIAEFIRGAGLILTEALPDLQSIPRCLVAQRRRVG